jgi:lysophospholipase L1-like esterase
MTPKAHPVIKTLAFLCAVGLFTGLWMNRPNTPTFDLLPFPRWDDFLHSTPSVLQPESIDTLLVAYDTYVRVDTSQALNASTHDTLTVQIASHIPQDTAFKTPLPPVNNGTFEASSYPRLSAKTSLHPNLQLQGSQRAFDQLSVLFNHLHLRRSQDALHIFHFGDSQIEGDRITRSLRTSWQKRWGGYGMGYLAPKPLVAPNSMTQTTSDGWERHARFGRRDSTIEHRRYGVLASFATHAPSLDTDETPWIRIAPRKHADQNERQVHSIKMLFGRTDSNARMTCQVDSMLLGPFLIPADSTGSELIVPIAALTASNVFKSIEFKFDGPIPEVDAIGMLPDTGLVFHNVAMRGSSGTLFRQLDRTQFSAQLKSQDVGMILLQFGGNAVPYIADTAAVERYGEWFASQIRLFQKTLPNAAIVVIGPSDMATKEEQHMVTYPMLVPVRNALRRAALNEDVLYWDVFEVMGGAGSMAAWVASEPSLASSDHVHFTRRGAKKIASLLLQSLDAEWLAWKQWHTENTPALSAP